MDELREVEGENGSYRGGSSILPGAGNGDGSHRDGGCSHGKEGGPGRSNHQMVDSRRLDGTVEANESGSGRCEEPRLVSMYRLSRRTGEKCSWDTYVSHAANASSFKILIVQLINGDLQVSGGLEFHESSAISDNMTMSSRRNLTLCRHGRGQPRSRRRQAQSGVRNL